MNHKTGTGGSSSKMNGCELIRVITKDDEECFLLTKLKNGGKAGLTLTVCHNGHVWTGDVSEDDLDDLSARLKMNVDKYVSQTVEALTSLSDSKHSFQYQLKNSKDGINFIWKKHVPAEDITFQLGSATLHAHEDSTRFITQMFEHCIQTMSELKERIHTLETDNERLAHERMNALKRLEKCVVAKEELEQEMYTKFSQVLNSKKEKIRQLKKQVEEGVHIGNGDDDDDAPEPSTGPSSTKRSHSPEFDKTEESKSASDVDTEEDTPKAKRVKGGVRKTKKVSADDSLDLGVDEEEAAPVTRPRRQRGRQQQKKQTPSKPVLPRIGSNESASGSAQKPRLRKSASGHSSKSSDNIDADDLMDQL